MSSFLGLNDPLPQFCVLKEILVPASLAAFSIVFPIFLRHFFFSLNSTRQSYFDISAIDAIIRCDLISTRLNMVFAATFVGDIGDLISSA